MSTTYHVHAIVGLRLPYSAIIAKEMVRSCGHVHPGKTSDAPLCMEEKSPKPKRSTPHESTNILLGMLCGHVENLVNESRRANEGTRRRNDEWQETLRRAGDIQIKSQRIGAIIVLSGICIMSTIISVVVSLLI